MKNLLIILFVAALTPAGFGQNDTILNNSINQDSLKSRLSVTYHANGHVKSNGHYILDKKTGEWNYWDENGNLIKLEQFENGLNSGDYIEYYSSGIIKVKGKFIIQNEVSIKHLYWNYYDENGEKTKSNYYFEGFLYEYDRNNVLINKVIIK